MRTLKLFLVGILGIFLSGCNQDLPMEPQGEQEIIFNIDKGELGLKGEGESDCLSEADYALIKLEGITEPIVLSILDINGLLYTTALKLPPGSYILEEFFLMKYGDPSDIVVSAAPHVQSNYGSFLVIATHTF